jgi:hypothetical protein
MTAQPVSTFDRAQGAVQRRLVGGGGDEPEVVAVFALVVVVDLRPRADQGGDALDLRRRGGERRQRRGADAARRQHGADTADGAARLQALERGENRRLVSADFFADLGERPRTIGKFALPVVEQENSSGV